METQRGVVLSLSSATLERAVHGGDYVDYRGLILKMLDAAHECQLRRLYHLIKAFLGL